jgi:hypothetical protein
MVRLHVIQQFHQHRDESIDGVDGRAIRASEDLDGMKCPENEA